MELYNQPKKVKPIQLFGLQFSNPVGMAAGFDKNALCWPIAKALGFGYVEIGTVTNYSQNGNSNPRLFRITDHDGLINRLGFNNSGANIIAKRLEKLKKFRSNRLPIGINIGKSKRTSMQDVVKDYLLSFQKLASYADYFTINVSSPNTPNLRKLQEKEFLLDLLLEISLENKKRASRLSVKPIPILLKISPDLSFSQIDSILAIIHQCKIDGVVATNTTIDFPKTIRRICPIQGGLSGKLLYKKTINIVKYIHLTTKGKLPIIAVGGIMDSKSASAMMNAGASLIQIYTGLIYNGPFFPSELAKSLIWQSNRWV